MSILRRYRLLLCVLGLAALAAMCELLGNAAAARNPQELPYVMLELYPESTHMLFVRGIHATKQGDLKEARRFFEQALATGDKTHEDLLYHYALTLAQMNEDEREIDAAIEAWKRNFPYSSKLDPREVLQAQQPAN